MDFRVLWEASPSATIACAADEVFTILAVTNQSLRFFNRTREQLLGQPLLATFSDVENERLEPVAEKLRKAIADKTPQMLDVFRYDATRMCDHKSGQCKERYWRIVDTPVLNECYEVIAVLHAFEDITELESRDKAEEQVTENLQCVNGEITAGVCSFEAQQAEIERACNVAVAAESVHEVNKTHFIGRLCHEVRNPLNGSMGNLELLIEVLEDIRILDSTRHDSLSDVLSARLQSAMQYAKWALDCSSHQINILNECLDISKIEEGKLTLEQTPFDFSFLIRTTVDMVKAKADKKRLELNIELLDQTLFLKVDVYRLRQVLLNFLDNAIKYTDKGSVTLSQRSRSLDSRRTEVFVTIQDTGIGISDKNQSKLFQRFSQVGSNRGGTGLGLAISRELVNLMGGNVTVVSEEGVGSSFTLTLICENAPESGIHTRDDLLCTDSPSNTLPSQQNDANIRVLLAEDNTFNQLVLINMLQSADIRFKVVDNGYDAFEVYKAERFDVILMDIQMPVLDGLQSTRQIREFETLKEMAATPIIGLSGNGEQRDKVLAFQAGMNDYLLKPCCRSLLISTLRRWAVRA